MVWTIKIETIEFNSETEMVTVNFTYDLPDGTVEKTSISVSPFTTKEDLEEIVRSEVLRRRIQVKLDELKQLEDKELE